MGRGSKAESLKQKPKLVIGFLRVHTQDAKHPFLQVFMVDTNGSTPDLSSIQDHIVGLGSHSGGICFQQLDIFLMR